MTTIKVLAPGDIGLHRGKDYPHDRDGFPLVAKHVADFVMFLAENGPNGNKKWQMPPEYENLSAVGYLRVAGRALYYVSENVLDIVRDELLSQDNRIFLPLIEHLQELCAAGDNCKIAMNNTGIKIDEEPDKTKILHVRLIVD